MIQHFNLNVKLLDSQIKKLLSVAKNETGLNLGLSSNIIGNSHDETNFIHYYY